MKPGAPTLSVRPFASMPRVLVAMSGGVDSSVAAALTARVGHEAIGVTIKLLPKLDTGFGCCGSPVDVEDARRVCESLGIRHYVVDMADLFQERVIDPFVQGYLSGRTPNPCVECNRSVKFGYLLRLGQAWDASFVATGHYARTEEGRLLRAADEEKDQTYFLYSLSSRDISQVMFPVGNLRKEEVRAVARELGLKTADKPESQEICFVPHKDYRGFLRTHMQGAAAGGGPIQDAEGRAVGKHEGLENYTIGQRRGLGVASSAALYVVGMDGGSNTLVVGPEEQTYRSALVAENISWTGEPPHGPLDIQARIRHRHPPAQARLIPLEDSGARVEFAQPQRAITPGQAVVFYQGDYVLGGGTIQKAL